jgi:hypothetical protein
MFARRTAAALLVTAVAASSLVASAGSALAATPNFVNDGGFEATHAVPDSNDDNPFWDDYDTSYGSVLCTLVSGWCGTAHAALGNGPRTGDGWAWFGYDWDQEQRSRLTQRVTVPEGSAQLSYWYRNGAVDAPFDATLYVTIDGYVVSVHHEASAPEADYHQYVADISEFADGGTHTLSFQYSNGSGSDADDGYNNMTIDDVAITSGS